MHDDGEDLLTPAEQYGWKDGEREQAQREMAERQAKTKREETLAWCAQRAERQRQPVSAEKTDAQSKQDEATATEYWKSYIRDQIGKNSTAMINAVGDAVGDVLAKEKKAREMGDDELRQQFWDVTARFDDHPRHDEITALYKTIDELRGRLDKLEAAPASRAPAPAIKSDGTPRGLDLDRLREWRH